ncbi:DinB family protein [uncultured Dokdonia sp.]|uniref:DinB family protein n=1 Tax=uncultured Dokdonia sp. TaxID=575653 RepID=UPI0026121914|nr:DinB family protein [uncultured Dokdonia sp.]
MINTWHQDFKDNAIFRLEENVRMISIALSKVVEEELWTKQNQSLNTLGNQLLHICGNMTQYIVSGLGGNPDERNREEEFSTEDGFTKDELLQRLLLTVQTSTTIIDDATPENLLKKRNVQGFELSGTGIILHVVEHFSYHTGQIAMQVKLVIDQPLKFYEGMNLNTLNEED